MYSPEQQSAIQIIADNNIQLPRFQRKKSWKESTRFELCISLFKEYPMGTIVLKKENKPKKVNWLLDGRQRRDTLIDMQNPENIYEWGKKYIKFSNNADDVEIRHDFERKLNEYLYYDETPDDDQETSEDSEDDPVDYPLEEKDHDELKDLLEIILIVHKKTSKGNGFTKPFDFGIKDFKPIYMVKNENGDLRVDSKRLTDWILSRNFREPESLKVSDILDSFDTNPPEELKKAIEERLDGIKRSIKAVSIIHDKLNTAKISVIVLDETCSQSDSQKIFEIINTNGEKLTNAEILSAKPQWNRAINEPRQVLIRDMKKLYEGLGTYVQSNVVIWDVAATFTCRLPEESDFIFGDLRTSDFDSSDKLKSKKVDSKINYGFKLYSGRYLGSIGKNDVDSLADKDRVDWNSSEFEDEISEVCKVLAKDAAMDLLRRYHVALKNLLGDTVAMCYLLMLIKKFNQIDGNKTIKGKYQKQFLVSSRVLFDNLVYEYCTKKWKGSSDSTLKDYLRSPEPHFSESNEQSWETIIQEVYKSNTINGVKIKDNERKALLYYFTLLRMKNLDLPPNEGAEIDHIIPESAYTGESTQEDFKDSLMNYALIPSTLNNKKKTSLKGLQPADLKRLIDLEDIDETFMDRTDPSAIEKLRTVRGHIIDEIIQRRKEFVKGEGEWTIQT